MALIGGWLKNNPPAQDESGSPLPPLKLVHVSVGSDWFAGALRQGFVFLDEALCDCARFARADDAAIDFHDGDDLGAGPGEEEFVGVEKIIARQVRLADGDT